MEFGSAVLDILPPDYKLFMVGRQGSVSMLDLPRTLTEIVGMSQVADYDNLFLVPAERVEAFKAAFENAKRISKV